MKTTSILLAIRKKWNQKPIQCSAIVFTFLIHCGFIFFLFFSSTVKITKMIPSTLIVRTTNLPNEPSKNHTKIALQNDLVKQRPHATKSHTLKSSPAAKKKVVPKQSTTTDKLLSDIQKSIDKIDKIETQAHQNHDIIVPKSIDYLSIDSTNNSTSEENLPYQELLIAALQKELQLPVWGKVKIELTLESSGKIHKIKVIEAENAGNQYYLEETIPNVALPSFEAYFEGEKRHTFIVTFCAAL